MKKISNRDKILSEGLRIVHERGLAAASVRDIVQAAGVPQGSFTNHFASKDAFGLEVLEIYYQDARALIDRTLCNDKMAPLKRLSAYLDASKAGLSGNGARTGCMLGNYAIEWNSHSPAIQKRLHEIFADIRRSIAYCLKAAINAGELPESIKADEVAAFIYSALQGAVLMSKIEPGPAPINRLKKILFRSVLR